MARIFISGSADGLGLMAGELLHAQGHAVVLHARNPARAATLPPGLPHVIGDLETIAGAKAVAEAANAQGPYDAVIHNAAVGYQERHRLTADNLPHVFAVNTLSAYILTALITRPARLVYLSSGLHFSASANLDDLTWQRRRWAGTPAYSESKLHDTMLAFAMARRGVISNAVEPGWVPTKMGGAGAPDDLSQGHLTQAWLATEATASGQYFYHLKPKAPNPQALDEALQNRLLARCAEISGVSLP